MRLAGIEPATHCLEGSCSIQVSYRRITSKNLFVLLVIQNVAVSLV
jgi:hypothetical protein